MDGRETAANLLNLTVWSLREQGLVEVTQLRPVESERMVMGGRWFARARPLPGETIRLGGPEGVLLTKMRTRGADRGLAERIADGLSDYDEWGLRRAVGDCLAALDWAQTSSD